MTTTVLKTFRSETINKSKLDAISLELLSRIGEIFELFNIECYKHHRFYQGVCPVHEGDNPTAFCLYNEQANRPGAWSCWTHHCEQIYTNTPLGLLRGLLSKQAGKKVSFPHTIDFALKFLNTDIKNIKINKYNSNNRFIYDVGRFNREIEIKTHYIDRNTIRQKLCVPAEYYIKRGYSREILDKYDIGLCTKTNRVVVPIYDDEHQNVIGHTDRSIYEECLLCKSHHNPQTECPTFRIPKWQHSNGLEREKILYNFWYARDFIKKSGKLILTESPGNVWRFEEAGIHNSLALFGTALNDKQRIIIDCSGATTLILCFDNDKNESGKKAAKIIQEKYERQYNIIQAMPVKNDIGEMTTNEVKNEYAIFGR